jgi:hypothetical protein
LTGLVVRRPSLDDLDAVVELGNAFELAFLGAESFGAGEIANDWRQLDLERDAWTGGTRLYERAGMHVVEETAVDRKDLS